MHIELTKDQRAQAVASIERFFRENMDEPIGNVSAGALLGFFLEEIGPLVYNHAIAQAQQRLDERIVELQARVAELDIELHHEPFGYWRKIEKLPPARRGGR